jgi:hypothetical protein
MPRWVRSCRIADVAESRRRLAVVLNFAHTCRMVSDDEFTDSVDERRLRSPARSARSDGGELVRSARASSRSQYRSHSRNGSRGGLRTVGEALGDAVVEAIVALVALAIFCGVSAATWYGWQHSRLGHNRRVRRRGGVPDLRHGGLVAIQARQPRRTQLNEIGHGGRNRGRSRRHLDLLRRGLSVLGPPARPRPEMPRGGRSCRDECVPTRVGDVLVTTWLRRSGRDAHS